MPFSKGSPGRPKGSTSQKQRDWKTLGEFLVTNGSDKYLETLEELARSKEFKDRVELMDRVENLLEYFKPKLARQEITGLDGKELEIKIINFKDA